MQTLIFFALMACIFGPTAWDAFTASEQRMNEAIRQADKSHPDFMQKIRGMGDEGIIAVVVVVLACTSLACWELAGWVVAVWRG